MALQFLISLTYLMFAYEEVAHLIEINLMKSFLETEEFQQYFKSNERQNAVRLGASLGLS